MAAGDDSRTTVTFMEGGEFQCEISLGSVGGFFVYFSRDCQKNRAQKIRAIFV
jgi:hypothetical protein